jgi:hypothetical protein
MIPRMEEDVRTRDRIAKLEERIPLLKQSDINRAMRLFARVMNSEPYLGSGTAKPLSDEERDSLTRTIQTMKSFGKPRRERSQWTARSR